MLVNATEMLIKARDGHYGVPQFNINNLEWTKAVLTACEEMKSPVILGVSEGAGKYMTGFKTSLLWSMQWSIPWASPFPSLCIWITAPTKAARPALRPVSPPSCSTAATTPSRRMWRRPRSWSLWHTPRA